MPWVIEQIQNKIATIDWQAATEDVERFLGTAERESLKLWSLKFFNARAAQLAARGEP